MSVRVQDIDRGWKRIKGELALMDNAHCKVGVQSDAGKHKDGETDIVTVAAVNEFGAPAKNIPERPFMRSTADNNRFKIEEIKKVEFNKIVDGVSTVAKSLDRMGLFMAKETIRTIDEFTTPPNAPSTIERKGDDNPLVDTGQMKQEIRHEVVLG